MRIVLLIVGFVALGLGSVGVFLPILPTTPFLLVAAFCFTKSSKKLERWFHTTKLYKNHLEGFKGRGMTVKAKAKVLCSVTVLLCIAGYCMRNVAYGFHIIGAVWLAHVIAFLFFVKTAKNEGKKDD